MKTTVIENINLLVDDVKIGEISLKLDNNFALKEYSKSIKPLLEEIRQQIFMKALDNEIKLVDDMDEQL